MWSSAIIFLTTFTLAASVRDKNEQDLVKCHAEGQGQADGMTVTWGVPKKKCKVSCGPTAFSGVQKHFTYEVQFADAFNVTWDKKCVCSAGGDVMVRFPHKNDLEAEECKAGTSLAIKEACWWIYMKARGTRFVGDFKVPMYKTPFTPSDFVVNNACNEKCEGEECRSIELPAALDGMSTEDKAAVGQAIKQIRDGKKDNVKNHLQELINLLPDHELDAAEFAAIDTDGDGSLSADELSDFYGSPKFPPALIRTFVRAVDKDESQGVEFDEFKPFKDQMRDYKPDEDQITGESTLLRTNTAGELVDAKASWQTVEVKCMKNGKIVDTSECSPETAEQAIDRFRTSC